jgi:hypothetical protein
MGHVDVGCLFATGAAGLAMDLDEEDVRNVSRQWALQK